MNFILVGIGGAIGAMLRYAVSLLPYKGDFPLITLLINLAGAFLIGIVSGTAAKKGASEQLLLFLKVGVCGGFTTFSAFSLEAYGLIRSDNLMLAFFYVVISIVLCLLGVFGGILIAESL